MTDDRYEKIKESLPDWVAGRLPPDEALRVEEAVRAHDELRAEARTLERLWSARPRPPEGLAARISMAARTAPGPLVPVHAGAPRRRSSTFRLPRWALAAAAVAVLALGTLKVVERTAVPRAEEGGPLDQVALEDTPSPWVTDDGSAAGAPVLFDDLSAEDLNTLLEELGG